MSKRRLPVLVSVAPGANGRFDRFCRCFALAALYVAVFLPDKGQLDAANGTNKGLIQAGMACALIAAISGPMPMMFITRLRL